MSTHRQLSGRVDLLEMAGSYFSVPLTFVVAGQPTDMTGGTFAATTDDDSTLTVDDTDAATGVLVVSGTVTAKARRWSLAWTDAGDVVRTIASGRVTARASLPI